MALPLVGAVTGAPGSAYWKFSGAARKRFGGRRVQELSPTAPSLGNRACSGLRHSLFDIATYVVYNLNYLLMIWLKLYVP